ncbi:MAG: DMT family transporter [Sciscionella sp.]|nr:DMT family transporter [Sciscionella sp.]
MSATTTPAADSARTIDWRALIAVLVTVLFWASAFVAIRGAGEYFGPGALALGRLASGSVGLLAMWLIRGGGLPGRKALPGIVTSGVLWFGVYMVALNAGEQQVDAGTSAMLVNIGPILIALLSGWLLHEGISRALIIGLAVSFAGAVIVGVSTSHGGHRSLLGVGLCLVAAVVYAIAVTAQKPALEHASALQVTTFSCLIGTLACLPFAGELSSEVRAAPVSATLSVLYLGVFPTALAFTTWAYALGRTTASKLGATTYVVPALVVLLSWAALGELPGLLTFVGGALCLGGVAITRRKSMRRTAPTSAKYLVGQQE